jgi:DNA invertase Pin-like site-specific DNA recombinase
LERQTEAARRWCVEHGHDLDESLALADLGVSAYSGDNASRGALAGFLAAIDAGRVPIGSVLLVESLDRLTRTAIPEAVGLLTSIVRAGVRVVSLIDGQEWNNTTINDTPSFLLSVLLFARAHEESATKSKRVSAAFQRKRNAKLPVVSVMHGPGWVQPRSDRQGWDLDPEKVLLVNRIFELAASGLGGVAIARRANQEGWPLPWRNRANTTGVWEHTAISRLLRDRRAIGEWQPKRMIAGESITDGEPVENYYPSAISNELWLKVQTALQGRDGPRRLRGIKADIFSGLLFCSCGKRLERKSASSRGGVRYYCVNRRAGLTECPPVAEDVLLKHVLSGIAQLEQDAFNPDLAAETARSALASAKAKVADLQEKADRLLNALEEAGHSNLLLTRLASIEKEKEGADAALTVARNTLASVPLRTDQFGYALATEASSYVNDPTAIKERHRLSVALAAAVKTIVWNGKLAVVTARSGTTIFINPPPEALRKWQRIKPKKKSIVQESPSVSKSPPAEVADESTKLS